MTILQTYPNQYRQCTSLDFIENSALSHLHNRLPLMYSIPINMQIYKLRIDATTPFSPDMYQRQFIFTFRVAIGSMELNIELTMTDRVLFHDTDTMHLVYHMQSQLTNQIVNAIHAPLTTD